MDPNVAVPQGAQCAVHAGAVAAAVCRRCGNFMCSSCVAGDLEGRCPSCRAVNAFELDANANLSQLWDKSWSTLQRELLMLVVAVGLAIGISMAGSMIAGFVGLMVSAILGLGVLNPSMMEGASLNGFIVGTLVRQGINLAISTPVNAFLALALFRVAIDALEGRKVDIARMFEPLRLLPRFLVIQIALVVVVSLPVLAGMGVIGFVLFRDLSASGLDSGDPLSLFKQILTPTRLLVISVGFVAATLYGFVMAPFSLFSAPEMLKSELSAAEVLPRVWTMAAGHRLRLVGYSMLGGALAVMGMFACCVGVLPAGALALLLVTSLFLALRRSAGFPSVG